MLLPGGLEGESSDQEMKLTVGKEIARAVSRALFMSLLQIDQGDREQTEEYAQIISRKPGIV